MVSLLARLPFRRDAGSAARSAPPAVLAAVATAAVTVAGLVGLGLALVVVQTLDPGGGMSVGASTGLGARLWLLAHGAELLPPSGSLVLAPLLLTLLVAWGLSWAGRVAVRALDDGASARGVVQAAGLVAVLHVALTWLLALVVDDDTAGTGWPRTLVVPAVLALLAAGWGAGRESGLVEAALDRLPGVLRPVLRGVLAGVCTALALGLTVVAVALASDAGGYAALSASLGGAGAGAVGLLGLSALYLPNAAVAVLGLAAGPGFFVGSGTLVSVHGVTLGAVPAVPLLAALPDTQAVPLIAFVSQAIPAVAGLVAGTTLGRWFGDRDGGSVVAGLAGLLAGSLLGVVTGALAWFAGGSLGDGALAVVGAPPVATGIAIAAQAGIAAAVAGAVTRWRSSG
ncbi:cell division protein PerM [Blastococcus sp. SYSU DS0539]